MQVREPADAVENARRLTPHHSKDAVTSADEVAPEEPGGEVEKRHASMVADLDPSGDSQQPTEHCPHVPFGRHV